MSRDSIPLFPLHSVLFPGGVLPLRIFEYRYLDMVSDCLRNNHGFGVCLIRAGREVGAAAESFDVGTLATIQDWDKSPDGLLTITVRGEQRFRVVSREVRNDQLSVAQVELLDEPPAQRLPVEFAPLARLLDRLLDDLDPPYRDLPRVLDDCDWVGARLAELLPLDPLDKQVLLEQGEPLTRLAKLAERLRS